MNGAFLIQKESISLNLYIKEEEREEVLYSPDDRRLSTSFRRKNTTFNDISVTLISSKTQKSPTASLLSLANAFHP
jgi:hypothetical protein